MFRCGFVKSAQSLPSYWKTFSLFALPATGWRSASLYWIVTVSAGMNCTTGRPPLVTSRCITARITVILRLSLEWGTLSGLLAVRLRARLGVCGGTSMMTPKPGKEQRVTSESLARQVSGACVGKGVTVGGTAVAVGCRGVAVRGSGVAVRGYAGP